MTSLILFDIDGTLLTPGTKLDLALLQPHMARLIRNGWIIGLNSGGTLKSLGEVHTALGLNGPIIAEFGNHLAWPSQNFKHRDFAAEAIMHKAKLALISRLTEILPNAHILKSDNVDFAPIRRIKAQTVDIVAVIMPRRYSVFYLCRLIDKTGTQFNHRLLHQVAPIAKQIVKQHFPGPLLQDLDESFCAHVIYRPNSHKSNGVLILQNHFPTLKEIHMVGDWDLDILHGIEGAQHYAVANAMPALKKVAVFTAQSDYAMGAIECLLAIEQNNCSPRNTTPWRGLRAKEDK